MVAAATKGIGLACAQELAAEGCRVSLCSRKAGEAGSAAKALPTDSMGYACDVSSEADLEGWFEATCTSLGPPDIVVTNTGGPPPGNWTGLTDEQWQQGVDSTLMNVIRTVRLVVPGMRERGWGRIVHITSLAAKEPSDILPISSTIRSGLNALTRLQATELAADGITVNSVLPGHTDTDRQRALARKNAEKWGVSEEQAFQRAADQIPMKRMGETKEIAAAVAFLCSSRASYITGTNLLVDGGAVSGIG